MTPPEVIDALAATLAKDLPAGISIERHPIRPQESATLPAIFPFFTAIKPRPAQDIGNQIREYDAEIRIECGATYAPDGPAMEQALWPMVFHVQKAMLGQIPPLDGWALNVEEGGIQFSIIERSGVFCAAVLDYKLHIAYRLFADPEGEDTLTEVTYCQH